MVLPLYLAMTAQEIHSVSSLPAHMAFMACHFSPSGPGLTNLPRDALPGQMLVLDDQFPFRDHSAAVICGQLEQILRDGQLESLLLDFQRPVSAEVSQMIRNLEEALPCPVAVSSLYAPHCRGPVFLPPAPPDMAIEAYLSPWAGREIWLEASLEPLCLTVTAQGCTAEILCEIPGETPGLPCPGLHCRCRMDIGKDRAFFHLTRSREDLQELGRRYFASYRNQTK